MAKFSLTLSILLASVLTSSGATNFSDCVTRLSTLETALYETGDNLFELNRIFFPPSARTSRFIRVLYTFLDEDNERDRTCSISYVWAIGNYLFFQPPRLFQFNSLYFNYPNNDLTALFLTLPFECRGLIESDDGQCTCTQESQHLDILTQQLNIYAKFTNAQNIQRENTFARAVCSQNLFDIYYDGDHSAFTFSLVSITIILPLSSVVIFFVSIRKLSSNTMSAITKPSNHDDIAALGFVGAMVTLFILSFDILACSVVFNGDHEYRTEVQTSSFNLEAAYVTLAFDILFSVPLFLCCIYLLYINIVRFFGCKPGRKCRQLLRCCCRVFLGKATLRNMEELSDDEAIVVLFPVVYAAPLLCFSSHVGYILLAWVTEPGKATSTLILFYAVLIYLFLSFRKCYRLHSGKHISLVFSKTTGKEQINDLKETIELGDLDTTPGNSASVEEGHLAGAPVRTSRWYCSLSSVKADKNYINLQAFCLLIFYSIFVVGISVIFISMLFLLPIASAQLITYIFNAVELVVVFITTYLAFKLFFTSGFSLKEMFESFRSYFTTDMQERDTNQTLVSIAKDEKIAVEVATGAIAAEFANLAVRGVKPSSQLKY